MNTDVLKEKVCDLPKPSESIIRFVERRSTILVRDFFSNSSETIIHYGIKGMHWGVRKSNKSVTKLSKGVKMNLQFFAKKASTRKTVRLSTKEYAHVMSELRTNITKEEKKHTVINKAIGNFMYSFENHFDDTYRVIKKKKIPKATTGLLERINDE